MKPVQLFAILDSVSTRKDRSIKLIFETREVTQEQFTSLFEMRDSEGVLVFSSEKIAAQLAPPDLPKKLFAEQKSPSQRLRAVIYLLWKQSASTENFENYYNHIIERYIDAIKEKLERR
ncbi:MAG: hypothetical protein JNK65_07920 [Deltaproteobacteria bacterium]|nr:hypothetical protein [Deltaproteobacteria bacterium]